MIAALLALALLAPQGAVGPVQFEGVATYCEPTPAYCQDWGDGAMVGAVESFMWGDQQYPVTVTYRGRSVRVMVVSYCACGERHGRPTVIDLSPAAFERLSPLSVGVLDPVVVVIGSDGIVLPPTDTEPATGAR